MSSDPAPVYARHVLCVLGQSLDFARLAEICAETGGEGFTVAEQQSQPHPGMVEAFDGSLTTTSFTDHDWDAVSNHDCVAYVLSPPLRPGSHIALSQRMLAVTAALLREGGATAAKNESSILAHSRDWWLALADDVAEAEDPDDRVTGLRQAWVKRPVYDGEVLFSSGMHLLGAADVELYDTDLTDRHLLPQRLELIDAFADYLLTEPRAAAIADGQRFRLSTEDPPWRLHHHDDTRNDVDDFGYNHTGLWRLSPAS